jgi:hypothetical protein
MSSSSPSSIGFGFLAFLLVAFGLYKFFFAPDPSTHGVVYINQELGISGRVTGYNKARGFKIFLDNSAIPYNFDAFANEQFTPDYGLGYYLEQGDLVNKLPNSSVLTLQKNGKTSQWHLVAPTPAPQN